MLDVARFREFQALKHTKNGLNKETSGLQKGLGRRGNVRRNQKPVLSRDLPVAAEPVWVSRLSGPSFLFVIVAAQAPIHGNARERAHKQGDP